MPQSIPRAACLMLYAATGLLHQFPYAVTIFFYQRRWAWNLGPRDHVFASQLYWSLRKLPIILMKVACVLFNSEYLNERPDPSLMLNSLITRFQNLPKKKQIDLFPSGYRIGQVVSQFGDASLDINFQTVDTRVSEIPLRISELLSDLLVTKNPELWIVKANSLIRLARDAAYILFIYLGFVEPHWNSFFKQRDSVSVQDHLSNHLFWARSRAKTIFKGPFRTLKLVNRVRRLSGVIFEVDTSVQQEN